MISNEEGKWKSFTWAEIRKISKFGLFRVTFFKDFVISNYYQQQTATLWTIWPSKICVCGWVAIFMSCSQRNLNQEGWWSTKPISVKEGALFQLHPYMQKSGFLQFTGAMTYTNKALLSFEDKFHGICQMLLLFNKQYEDSYSLSWMNCLDESISSWLNQHCPGFMYIPCKPHPRGNKYHLIADRDQGKSIMWQVKLQEGKHHPRLTVQCHGFHLSLRISQRPQLSCLQWQNSFITR